MLLNTIVVTDIVMRSVIIVIVLGVQGAGMFGFGV